MNKLTNRDKRSLILSTVIGDGCLNIGNKHYKRCSGYLTIKHGIKQEDYLKWKTEILSKVMERNINIRSTLSYVKATNKHYPQRVMQVGSKKFKAWRRFFYKNGNKQIGKILKFIRHPGFCLATWMMDDGSVNDPKKKKTGTKVLCGTVLYICDQDRENVQEIHDWLVNNFNIKPKVRYQKQTYKGTIRFFPKIEFNVQDSLIIWQHIRPFVVQIPSMMEKFDTLEKRSNKNYLLQPQALTTSQVDEDIVQKVQ